MKRIKRLLFPALALFGLLSLSGCGERVEFADKKLWTDAKAVHLVIESGETALLDRFEQLERADLRGSGCYEEICAWGAENPQVELIYDVALPDGRRVENSETELDLSGISPAQAEETAALLAFLPALERVELGDENGSLGPGDLAPFGLSRPDLSFGYSFSLKGQSLEADASSLSLPGLSLEEMEKLKELFPIMTDLESLDLGAEEDGAAFPLSAVAELQALRPETRVDYSFSLFGRTVSTGDTELDMSHVSMDDGGAAVRQALACMPELRYLDMDSCGVPNEEMAAIRDDFPQVEVVWRVWFGESYSVRTDVERILASMPSKGGLLTAENSQALKYCTKVKYIDIGHNPTLNDISFLSYMPELEVAVLAMQCWSDASPLASCPKLEYLEIQTTSLSDLSPLAGLENLRHLNICYLFELDDISPLYGLTELERLWIGCLDPVPQEQIDEMQRLAPNCVINTSTYDPTEGGWRYVGVANDGWTLLMDPRYELLREQFGGYDLSDYAFYWNDPLY